MSESGKASTLPGWEGVHQKRRGSSARGFNGATWLAGKVRGTVAIGRSIAKKHQQAARFFGTERNMPAYRLAST